MPEPRKTTKKERKQFFVKLKERCSAEDVYSVIETAEDMDTPYEQVQEWANKNKQLKRILEECRAMCANHASSVDIKEVGMHEYQRIQEYIFENDDEAKEELEAWRAKRDAEEKAEKEAERKKKELKEQQEKELRKGAVVAIGQRSVEEGSTELTTQDKAAAALLQEKKEVAQLERLTKWKEKKALEDLGCSIKKNTSKSTDDSVYIETSFDDPNLTPSQKNDIELSNICAATGMSGDAGSLIFFQVIEGRFKAECRNMAYITNATQEALIAMKPADIYEGQLCSRLVVLHDHYMVYMARAAHPDQTLKGADLNINRATKLMRLYNETFEALNKYRRKGEQKVVVQHQHVNVQSGGQAAVGNFQAGGGDNGRK